MILYYRQPYPLLEPTEKEKSSPNYVGRFGYPIYDVSNCRIDGFTGMAEDVPLGAFETRQEAFDAIEDFVISSRLKMNCTTLLKQDTMAKRLTDKTPADEIVVVHGDGRDEYGVYGDENAKEIVFALCEKEKPEHTVPKWFEINDITLRYLVYRARRKSGRSYLKQRNLWKDTDPPYLRFTGDRPISEELGRTVIIVNPGNVPVTKRMEATQETFEQYLGGPCGLIDSPEPGIVFIERTDGKEQGLSRNRAIYDSDKKITKIIRGAFIIIGQNENGLVNLSYEMIEKYMKRFENVEVFLNHCGKLSVIHTREDI